MDKMQYSVSLQDVLDAKEKRAALQFCLRQEHHSPLMSISVNMPGNVKYNSDIVSLLHDVLATVRSHLSDKGILLLEERFCHLLAGPTVLVAAQGEAEVLKDIGIWIEDNLIYGRLVDIDVFDADGRPISRADRSIEPRRCFICARQAVICMRSGTHSRADIEMAAGQLLQLYRAERTNVWPGAVAFIGQAALEAMLTEVACTPAPGLVDRCNSGSHRDMDFFSFIMSSSAISAAMYQCAMAGWEHEGEPAALLPILRTIGAEAEQRMFVATQGVNTQKGLLFLMGIITAAAAMLARSGSRMTAGGIIQQAAVMCRGIVKRELSGLKAAAEGKRLTAGERLYLERGITGIRGEIEAGLPVVCQCGLPALERAFSEGLVLNDALVHALLALMTETEDTTILNRHDLSALQYVKQEAKTVMAMGGMLSEGGRTRIRQLDELFIQKNISPGGSADLLAVTYFLYKVERYFPL